MIHLSGHQSTCHSTCPFLFYLVFHSCVCCSAVIHQLTCSSITSAFVNCPSSLRQLIYLPVEFSVHFLCFHHLLLYPPTTSLYTHSQFLHTPNHSQFSCPSDPLNLYLLTHLFSCSFNLLVLILGLRNLIRFQREPHLCLGPLKEQLILNQTCHSLHCTVPAQGCWRAAILGSVCFSQPLSCGRWWTWREAGNWKIPWNGTETTTYRGFQDSPLIKHGPHP